MTDVSHANRRIHTRHNSRIPARLAHTGDAVDGHVENIGVGGVFFATHDLELDAEEGSEVTVCFAGRRDGAAVRVESQGVVLRTERYFDGENVVRAFAVKFADVLSLDCVELG